MSSSTQASDLSTAKPSEIWTRIIETYDQAQAEQAATMTDTLSEVLVDGGISFSLRIATKLRDKPKNNNNITAGDGKSTKKEVPKKPFFNPFLPPDPSLFVGHLSSTHSLVLNKFNVVPHHTLVITKEFHAQEEPLSPEDFDATWRVIQASGRQGGLAYFNCGPVSGASQPHKHVQIIPLPILPDGKPEGDPPFWPVIAASTDGMGGWQELEIDTLPFINCVALLDTTIKDDTYTTIGARLAELHGRLVDSARQKCSKDGEDFSFNTLMTQDFVMVIPRKTESSGPVNCNAMAFAGSFFVRGEDELEYIKTVGPMEILQQVGFGR